MIKEDKRPKRKQAALERARRRKLQTILGWGAAGVVILSLAGLIIRQATVPVVGEEVAVDPNYVTHVGEDTDPGPYPSNPPAGGRHFASEFNPGFYEEGASEIQLSHPEGYLVHNQEHGYVIFWYNCDRLSDASQCDLIKENIRQAMEKSGERELIAFPWPTLNSPIALSSWGKVMHLDSFDEASVLQFIKTNINKSPEAAAQ